MKKTLILLVILFASLTLTAQVNDPNAEIRQVKSFHGISVSSAFDVYLNQGKEDAVAVSAESIRDREHIKVEVKDGILNIRFTERGIWQNAGNRKLKAYISFKQIDKLKISGHCDVFVTGTLKADQLDIKQSGASDLKAKVEARKLSIDLSGASDIEFSGKTDQLFVDISGASQFKGFDLETDICQLRASGASAINITVHKEISARASGASDIVVKGEGEIKNVKTSGGASINRSKS